LSHRVILVASEFPPGPGGIGNHAHNLAIQLAGHGFKVEVVAESRPAFDHESSGFDRMQPFAVTRFPCAATIPRRTWRRQQAVRAALSTSSSAIVIASGQWPLYAVALAAASKRRHHHVAIAHGVDVNPGAFAKRLVLPRILSAYDRIVAVSHYTASVLPRCVQNRVAVINNGFSGRLATMAAVRRDLRGYPKLVTVGSVTERKGQINVVRALPHLLRAYPDLHYHMIGSPVERARLEQLAESLNVGQHISFHGVLADSEVASIVRASDVFVMLSNKTKDGDFEGFGIAILEANSLGVPAIGARDCGIADAISDGKTGVLVDPHSATELGAALSTVLQDRPAFSRHAFQHSRRFLWEQVVKKYLSLFTQLTAATAARAANIQKPAA
jgi:phosphatidylinositol alpha-1,6-mannosyltransferase